MVLIGCAHINAGCLRTYEVPSGKCNVYLTKNRSLGKSDLLNTTYYMNIFRRLTM